MNIEYLFIVFFLYLSAEPTDFYNNNDIIVDLVIVESKACNILSLIRLNII